MILIDAVVNYAIRGIQNTFKVDGLQLVEKTTGESKVKFKFDRMGLKLTVEFPNSDLASIVYYNFLEDEVRDDIMEFEFVERFKDYLDVSNPFDSEAVEKAVKRICDDIRSSKLFKGNGKVMKQQAEPQDEIKKQSEPIAIDTDLNSIKEIGYIQNSEEPNTPIEPQEVDYIEAEIIENDKEPEEFLDEEENQEEIF